MLLCAICTYVCDPCFVSLPGRGTLWEPGRALWPGLPDGVGAGCAADVCRATLAHTSQERVWRSSSRSNDVIAYAENGKQVMLKRKAFHLPGLLPRHGLVSNNEQAGGRQSSGSSPKSTGDCVCHLAGPFLLWP